MRMHRIRSVSLTLFACVALAGTATAQDESPDVLNTVEFQRLVASDESADHVRLSAHFRALADQYTAEARRHEIMSRRVVGNPNRNRPTGMRSHCVRLADLNRQSAELLRELATHHEKLAGVAPSAPPPEAARFEGGAGTAAPTPDDLDALAASASTPADHRDLAEYFETLARRHARNANRHAAMASAYRGSKRAPLAGHCTRLVRLSREAAKEARNAAATHEQLARAAR